VEVENERLPLTKPTAVNTRLT